MRKKRVSPEVNAGSMADIAFLLLIFFLVTTTIASDQGILVTLPPWTDEIPEDVDIKKRNLARVAINANDQIMVRDKEMQLEEIKAWVKEFIANPNQQEHLAEASNKALISLINDRGTNYDTYLSVYNELKAAYLELWDEMAQSKYGNHYERLSSEQQKTIRTTIPMVISEADPTDLAGL
ncbi:MAG: biopolymer transporter ExbD [Bacteroidota bacterium]